MRSFVVCVLVLGAALPATVSTGQAASLPSVSLHTRDMVVTVGSRRRRPPRGDCTPYNGPFGFYGNIWCQPPNDMSYLRNLGASWPMNTPPNLRKAKPHDTGSDW
jgi:hypothetical protein